jgi:hypothetical protein
VYGEGQVMSFEFTFSYVFFLPRNCLRLRAHDVNIPFNAYGEVTATSSKLVDTLTFPNVFDTEHFPRCTKPSFGANSDLYLITAYFPTLSHLTATGIADIDDGVTQGECPFVVHGLTGAQLDTSISKMVNQIPGFHWFSMVLGFQETSGHARGGPRSGDVVDRYQAVILLS